MTPQKYASKTRGELLSWKSLSRSKYLIKTQKQEYNIRKERAQTKAKDNQLERKKSILKSQGKEINEKNLSNIKFVSKKTYSKISELKKQGKNPVLLNNQLYEDKNAVVKNVVISKTMKEPLERAKILNQWDRKRYIEDVKDKTKTRMEDSWKEKKDQSNLKKDLTTQTPSNKYYQPERKKSPQETMDVTSQMDWKQFVPLDKKTPDKETLNKINKNKIIQERKEDNINLKYAKETYQMDWKHPIKTMREASDIWGQNLDVQKENIQGSLKDLKSQRSDAILNIMDLSKSSESISPSDYKNKVQDFNFEIETSKAGLMAPVVATAGTIFISVAKGSKSVFVDMPLHPIETAKNLVMLPVNAPEIIVQTGKAIMEDPIGAPVELATQMWAFGKVSKGLQRIVKPKITETPVKGKGVESIKTMRKDPKTGKITTDQQIKIKTELGKPQKRFFWEKPKIKPRKNLNVELTRTTKSNFQGSEVLEGSSKVKGKIIINKNKIKLSKSSIKETTTPKKVFDLDQGMTGKTSSGVKLSGKTGKLKDSLSFDKSIKTRAGHTRTLTKTKERIITDKNSRPVSDIQIDESTSGSYHPFSKKIQLHPKDSNPFGHTARHEAGHHIDMNRGFGKKLKQSYEGMKEFKKITKDGGKFNRKIFEKRGYSQNTYTEYKTMKREMRAEIVADYLKNPKKFTIQNPEIGKILNEVTHPKSTLQVFETTKQIKVKPSSKTTIKKTTSKTYRSKKLTQGDLILEETMKGDFVKRNYNKKPKGSIDPDPTITKGIYSEGEFITATAKQSKFKNPSVQIIESGKKVKIGSKPLSYKSNDLSKAIDKLYKEKPTSKQINTGSNQKMVLETKEMSLKSAPAPVIDVISSNLEFKGKTLPLVTLEDTQPKGRSMMPTALQQPTLLEPETKTQTDLIIDTLEDPQRDDLAPIIDSLLDQETKPTTINDQIQTPILDTGQESIAPENLIQEPIVDTIIEQRERQISVPIQIQDQYNRSDYTFEGFIENENIKTPMPPLDKKDKDLFDDDFLKGFDVFVKRKGNFEKLNAKGSLSESQALFMGSKEVDRSASATFKIVESDSPMARGRKSQIKDKILLDQFYKKDGTYIEKSKFRIDTPEEVRGISALGNMAKQTGNFFKSMKTQLPKMMDDFAVPSMTGNHKKTKGGLFR